MNVGGANSRITTQTSGATAPAASASSGDASSIKATGETRVNGASVSVQHLSSQATNPKFLALAKQFFKAPRATVTGISQENRNKASAALAGTESLAFAARNNGNTNSTYVKDLDQRVATLAKLKEDGQLGFLDQHRARGLEAMVAQVKRDI